MKALRVGLCALAAFSVLAHGVVEAWSIAVLEIGAALLLLVWAFAICFGPEAKIEWSALNWPFLGFIAVGVGQLLFHATAYPYLTREELLLVAAYFIFFFLAAQAFRTRADMTMLLWFLIFLGFSVSLLGIIQHFTSPNEIYWFRRMPQGGDAFGPYVNRNHFAGFVELVAPVALSLIVFRGMRRDLFLMAGLLAIVPIGALILSGSRGGIVSFAFEIGVLALLARSRRGREGPRIGAIAIIALAALALIVWLGAGHAIERFSTMHPGEVTLSRRYTMFVGASHVFRDHIVSGAGLGTLVSVYPRYETFYDGKLIDHVHNDYIETLAETGILGGICGLLFLGLLFRQAQKAFRAEQGHFSRGLHAAAIAALAGILLHGFVDFNLHIPSNVLLLSLQAYLATSAPLPSEAPSAARRYRSRSHDESVPSEVAG
jgi:O-antigen ligase